MTTIKFRGFRTDNNEPVYGFYSKFEINSGEIDHVIFEPNEPVFQSEGIYFGTAIHHSSLGMFTGRTDKNGKEIYGAIGEKGGDNAKCVVSVFGQGESIDIDLIGDIRFELGSFILCHSDEYFKNNVEISYFDDKSIEIIGNQWEADNGK